MATEVLVPPLGQTVDTLTLVSWYKHEGEAVEQGEPLFAVETDKATLDVEAPASGILQHATAAVGDEVKVLSAIAVIVAPGESPAERATGEMGDRSPALPFSHSLTLPLTQPAAPHRRIFVSPRARRLAESEGVPLSSVKATGPEGAIIERDVRAYAQEVRAKARAEGLSAISAPSSALGSTAASTSVTPVARRIAEEAGLDLGSLAGTGPRGQIVREDVERAVAESRRAEAGESGRSPTPLLLHSPGPAELIPLTGIRAVIAERMAASHSQTAPVTLTAEADATALVELRKQLAADGVAVSYNDLLLHVLARALREHPRLNATLEGNGMPGAVGHSVKLWRRIDIGLAVDTDRGLLVPVVRDVASKGLAQLASETQMLAERARAGKCAPDELTDGTFTLTNLGMFGIDAFTPLINLPETAILGVGRIKARPVVVGTQIVARQIVWLSLTFDHRLVDGGPAARFLQRVVQLVERPHLLIA